MSVRMRDEDEELAALRLAALISLKSKTAEASKLVDSSIAKTNYIQTQTYPVRKNWIHKRRSGNCQKSSSRSNLIVITPANEEKPMDENPVSKSSFCHSTKIDDSAAAKSKKGPSRFSRYESGSSSSSDESDIDLHCRSTSIPKVFHKVSIGVPKQHRCKDDVLKNLKPYSYSDESMVDKESNENGIKLSICSGTPISITELDIKENAKDSAVEKSNIRKYFNLPNPRNSLGIDTMEKNTNVSNSADGYGTDQTEILKILLAKVEKQRNKSLSFITKKESRDSFLSEEKHSFSSISTDSKPEYCGRLLDGQPNFSAHPLHFHQESSNPCDAIQSDVNEMHCTRDDLQALNEQNFVKSVDLVSKNVSACDKNQKCILPDNDLRRALKRKFSHKRCSYHPNSGSFAKPSNVQSHAEVEYKSDSDPSSLSLSSCSSDRTASLKGEIKQRRKRRRQQRQHCSSSSLSATRSCRNRRRCDKPVSCCSDSDCSSQSVSSNGSDKSNNLSCSSSYRKPTQKMKIVSAIVKPCKEKGENLSRAAFNSSSMLEKKQRLERNNLDKSCEAGSVFSARKKSGVDLRVHSNAGVICSYDRDGDLLCSVKPGRLPVHLRLGPHPAVKVKVAPNAWSSDASEEPNETDLYQTKQVSTDSYSGRSLCRCEKRRKKCKTHCKESRKYRKDF